MKLGKNYWQPWAIENEIWKSVNDFEQYSVSNMGRIRVENRIRKCGSIFQGRVLSPNESNNICLCKEGKRHWFKLPQLIMKAFVGNPPKGKELVRHLDDDITNNSLTNLAWGSHKDNSADAIRNGIIGIGSPPAIANGLRLKGVSRPEGVKRKISETKRSNPDRQYYGIKRDSVTGRCSKV